MRLWSVVVIVVLLGVAMPWAAADMGVALIEGTSAGSALRGQVDFEDTEDGLRVTASLSGVAPGQHGFHIHEFGSCADGGKAAGGHFNPDGNPHGDLLTDGLGKAHAGDLGNVEIDEDGTGTLALVLPDISLRENVYSVVGRAIIMHADPDDFGQPTGNAGSRIACGAIVLTAP